MIILILFAFIGGVVTILSPCILPILPIILAGSVGGGKSKPFGVVTGFVLSFTFFTLFLTTIVNLTGLSADFLRNFSVIILGIFGLALIVPKIQTQFEILFSKLASYAPKQGNRNGFGGGMLIGLSLGLIWTPCVGPILASVISLALTGSVSGSAFIITLAYSLGTAIPMFMIMYGGRELLNRVPWLLNNTRNIQKIFGAIMIITAMLIFFNIDRSFQSYILQKFPNYGVGLTSIEDNEKVKQELDRIEQEKNNNKIITVSETRGKAPELILGGGWINSEPLTLESLKGQVVLIDFMTYSCINCIRTFPILNNWYEKYNDKGLTIIGIHTPEFEFEKNIDNVSKALTSLGIKFPIMQDNNYATWNAYQNRYWPHEFLIDHNGYIVYDHIGEGEYDKTEEIIKYFLKERQKDLDQVISIDNGGELPEVELPRSGSPEIYFGSARNSNLGNGKPGLSGEFNFSLPSNIKVNTLYLSGRWNIKDEYAESIDSNSKIIFKYDSTQVFIVAGANENIPTSIFQDDKSVTNVAGEDVINGIVNIQDERLYRLIDNEKRETHTIKIVPSKSGLKVFTFTFG